MDPKEFQDMNGIDRYQGENDLLCSGACDGAHRRRYLINFLVVMFGIGGSVSLNGVAAEVPLLVMSAPEGSKLSSNLVITLVVAYMGPALYALFNRSTTPRKARHEFIWISGVLVLGTVAMVFLAFFYNVTVKFNAVDHSIVMIFLVFILALVAASENVLLMPYLRNIEEASLTSFFIGERLSGFVPSIIALIQGVGGDPLCPRNATNSTDPPMPYIHQPKFSSRTYFFFVSALLGASTCSFWLLEYLRVQTSRKKKKDAEFDLDRVSTKEHIVSLKQLLSHESTEKVHEIEMDAADPTPTSPAAVSGTRMSNGGIIYLCALMWLACLVANGYLNTLEAFSSRPYGNSAFHLVANLSQLAGTAACVLAFWLPPSGTQGITGIMGLVLVASTYVTWLALCSPMPPWRDTAYGVYPLVTIWVILISLVSYAKLAITAIVWRETSDRGIYQLGFANLLGSICSAGITFYLVNFTALFTPYTPCRLQ